MFRWFRKRWPQVPFDEIRKRARLLVIDDQEFAYKTLFERDGYTIEKWSDVEALSRLEEGAFDLILLDLQGVGRRESTEEGFGILKHLRDRAPAQIIVAYSNADWGLQYQDFFRLADAVLPKSADYVDFKRRVDELLRDRFSLGFYLARIRSEAQKLELPDSELVHTAEKAILARDPTRLRSALRRHSLTPAQVDRFVSIANAAINLLNLWNA